MRLIAYIHPSQDAYAVRAQLRQRGWAQVAMRDGSLWRAGSQPEPGWPAIHAPGYPQIARAYAERGAEVVAGAPGDAVALPAAPVELEALPPAAVWAILNPGRHLRAELAAVPLPPACSVIAVNEAARVAGCNWQLCNDGFADPKFHAAGTFGRLTRSRFAGTIPSGTWVALERFGIHDGTFSTTCALIAAGCSGAKEVWLYGHDCTIGNGVDGLTGHWDAGQLSNLVAEVDAAIGNLKAAGIKVVHVRMTTAGPRAVITPPARRRRT